MAALEIKVSRVCASPRICMIALTGGVEAKSYVSLESVFKTVFGKGYRHVVLNLSGLRFMNEPDKLRRYEAAFSKAGGGLVLYEVPAKLRVVFGTLDLDQKIPIRGSLQDAVSALIEGEPADRRSSRMMVAVDRRIPSEATTPLPSG